MKAGTIVLNAKMVAAKMTAKEKGEAVTVDLFTDDGKKLRYTAYPPHSRMTSTENGYHPMRRKGKGRGTRH